jgi:hypothetical protein
MLSDLFFIINYSVTITASVISLTLCFLIIITVITHRQCRDVANLLTCNTCVAIGLYFIARIITAIFALPGDWKYHQPACAFRGYCSLALCAAFCYSYSIQAISRLFFAVFYKHRYLLTFRTHWILIIINWLISIIISILPFFVQNGFEFEQESRSCVVTPSIPSVAFYTVITVFIIPLNTVTIVHGIIFRRVQQSGRRVTHFVSTGTTAATSGNITASNAKRELILMQKMSTQSGIITCGGILYLILVIWNATQEQSPPESFYLLSINLISIFTAIMMIAIFFMNKKIKDIVVGYVRPRQPSARRQTRTQIATI